MKLPLAFISLLNHLAFVTLAYESRLHPSLGVRVGSAVNVHCYKEFELECHPYVAVSLSEERVEESTSVIQCSRHPKWEYSLLFSPKYCVNQENPAVGYTLNTDSIENLQRHAMRGSLKLELSRIPPGVNKFWVMLDDIPSAKGKYLLPTCVELELTWKPEDCKEYSWSSGYTQIDGDYLRRIKQSNQTRAKNGLELNLCKPELVGLFLKDDKQADLQQTGLDLEYCSNNETKFQFNKNIEKGFYFSILRKYFNLLGYNDKVFIMHYSAYLRFNSAPDEVIEEFRAKALAWGDPGKIGLGITPAENAEYLNDVVRIFFTQKDKVTGASESNIIERKE